MRLSPHRPENVSPSRDDPALFTSSIVQLGVLAFGLGPGAIALTQHYRQLGGSTIHEA